MKTITKTEAVARAQRFIEGKEKNDWTVCHTLVGLHASGYTHVSLGPKEVQHLKGSGGSLGGLIIVLPHGTTSDVEEGVVVAVEFYSGNTKKFYWGAQ